MLTLHDRLYQTEARKIAAKEGITEEDKITRLTIQLAVIAQMRLHAECQAFKKQVTKELHDNRHKEHKF